MFEMLSVAPDMIEASGASDSVQYLAQSGEKTTIGGGDKPSQGLNVEFAPNVEKLVRVIAIALGVAWALYLVWNLGKPGGSRQAVQRMGGVVGIVAALTAIVGGLNINTTMKLIDSALQIGWAIIQTVIGAFK